MSRITAKQISQVLGANLWPIVKSRIDEKKSDDFIETCATLDPLMIGEKLYLVDKEKNVAYDAFGINKVGVLYQGKLISTSELQTMFKALMN
jgi:hypothetical protein